MYLYNAIRADRDAHPTAGAFAAGIAYRPHAPYIELRRYLYEIIRAIDDAQIASLAPVFLYLQFSHSSIIPDKYRRFKLCYLRAKNISRLWSGMARAAFRAFERRLARGLQLKVRLGGYLSRSPFRRTDNPIP